MRVTIVTGPWLPVPAIQGGSVPRMWHGLAEEFARLGHDVLILARAFPGQPPTEIRNGVNFRRRGGFAQTNSTSANLTKDLIYALDLLPRLPKSDILVFNDFWLPILVGRLRSNPGAVVVSANRFPKGQYRLYGNGPRVIAASQAIERAILAQAPALAGRVCTIPNPFDTTTFIPPVDNRAGRSGKTILYAGRLHREKAVHVLVSAFARIWSNHKDINLRIIGPSAPGQGGGGETYLRELNQLGKGLPVTIMPPEFDTSRLAETYQQADLFCYPSMAETGEALPVAPLEAMSTGLPVVVSSLECFTDFIRPAENGLCFDHRAGDPVGELARTLENALQDWKGTLEIGRRGKATANAFSLPVVARRFISEFEGLRDAQGLDG